MSSATQVQPIATLRAIVYRISSTPTKHLPQIAGQVASSLWSCRYFLSAPHDTNKSSSESSNLVHRFKTKLSSLLQDRTIEGRWAGVVLVKATIEAGGVETLSKSNGWVRSLLSILKKPDPATTRNLAVVTLTRIFMLTWDYSNLVREITTPALPGLISSCLRNVSHKDCAASELQTVLEAFATLVPRHPTIFRTNELEIRKLLRDILSSTSSDNDVRNYGHSERAVAQRLLTLLHCCAPKQTSGEKWDETLVNTISAAHKTCDRLFRSVVEHSIPKSEINLPTHAATTILGIPDGNITESSGVDGILPSSDRLVTLLGTLQVHFDEATAGAVNVRVGLVSDLLDRVVGVTETSRTNNDIPKDEREALFSVLPSVHVAAMETIISMLDRFGNSIVSTAQSILEHVIYVFRAEAWDVSIRIKTYQVLKVALDFVGPTMSKDEIADIGIIIKACCDDILPLDGDSKPNRFVNGTAQKPPSDLSLQASSTQPSHPTLFTTLQNAAEALLPALLTKLHPANVPRKLRVQMERTAILSRNKEALIACVMNPARKDAGAGFQTSLLPLLARQYPDSSEVEALVRPRMPPIVTTSRAEDEEDFYDDEEEEPLDDVLNGETDNVQHEALHDSPPLGVSNGAEQDGIAGAEEEDLYSVTPDRDAVSGEVNEAPDEQTAHASSTAKRPAAAPLEEEVSAKRLRASPLAEAVVPESVGSLPGSASFTAAFDRPSAMAETSENAAMLPNTTAPDASARQMDSDESDFETPPLTMESDSDPEDEEDEE